MKSPHAHLSATSYRLLVGAVMCALYVLLWLFVEAGGRLWNAGGVADLPFLPAAVRLIGFLMIGLWIVPSLFLAFAILTLSGAMAYSGIGTAEQLGLGLLVASGGPLAIALTARLAGVSTDLVDLRLPRVILLALACASGNAVAYNAGLAALGLGVPGLNLALVIFVGDLLGCVIVLGVLMGVTRLIGGHARG